MPKLGFERSRNLFIRRWGEMAASWGISRTMAEIHALMFLAVEPLCTDDIMGQLQVSRGSASVNLRELCNWGLIQRIHRRGDRKEYFLAEKDVWQMFETITRERRRREVQPIVETLEQCLDMIRTGDAELDRAQRQTAKAYQKRFSEILKFCESMNSLFNLVSKMRKRGIKPLTRALNRLAV